MTSRPGAIAPPLGNVTLNLEDAGGLMRTRHDCFDTFWMRTSMEYTVPATMPSKFTEPGVTDSRPLADLDGSFDVDNSLPAFEDSVRPAAPAPGSPLLYPEREESMVGEATVTITPNCSAGSMRRREQQQLPSGLTQRLKFTSEMLYKTLYYDGRIGYPP